MKVRILNIRQIILIALMIGCFKYDIYSQGTDISGGKHTGIFVGFSLGPSKSLVDNEGTPVVSKLMSGKMNSSSGSVETGYLFSRYFGISSGIGFISYNTQVTLASYQNNLNIKDSENESYELRVSAADVKEIQKVSSLSIPFCFTFHIPFTETFGLFLEPGLNIAVPLNKEFKSSGTFTYKGYYPAYNVILENLPAYNFPSDKSSNSEGELELKKYWVSTVASAGIDFFIQRKIQITAGVCYTRSLSNISQYTSTDQFQLSTAPGQLNSLMGGTTKVTTSSMGLKISLRYYLK